MSFKPVMKASRGTSFSARHAEPITGYLFLLPDFLGLLIFLIIPIGYAFFISLHDWNGLSSMRWNGLDNYVKLFSDSQFWDSLKITGIYTLIYVPVLYAVSLGLALLVNQRLPFMRFFRTIFFVPVVLSLVVSSLMWKYIFDERSGLLNFLIGFFGIQPQPWLGSVQLALPSIIVVSVWIQMGYFMVIFSDRRCQSMANVFANHSASTETDQSLCDRDLVDRVLSGIRSGLGYDERRPGACH
jgi:multiple sugar transport system permease protein